MQAKFADAYRSILSFAGVQDQPDGSLLSVLSKEEPTPLTFNGLPVVFPTRSQLDDIDQKKLYFSPLTEAFIRGESEIIQMLRNRIAVRLNYVTAVVTLKLSEILSSPAMHRQLTEDQSGLLQHISEADSETMVKWSRIVASQIKENGESAFVKLYLRKQGTYKVKNYSRVGIVTFPFFQKLMNDEFPNLRQKDKVVFKKLMHYVFPNLDVAESYNFGTHTRVAPFLTALMYTAEQVASKLNDIVDIFKPLLEDPDHLVFDMDWDLVLRQGEDLQDEILKLPVLNGNAGTHSVSERNHPSQDVQAKPAVAPAPTPAPVTERHTPPPVSKPTPQVQEKDKVSFGDMLRHNPAMMAAAAPAPQYVYAAPPHQYQQPPQNYNYQQPPVNYGYQQPMQHVRPPQNLPSWGAPGANLGFQQPHPNVQYQQQPYGYQQPAPQPPFPPPGPPPYGQQWAFDPNRGWFLIPQQQQNMNYPHQPQNQLPGGWNVR